MFSIAYLVAFLALGNTLALAAPVECTVENPNYHAVCPEKTADGAEFGVRVNFPGQNILECVWVPQGNPGRDPSTYIYGYYQYNGPVSCCLILLRSVS
jgi:hypothetical protein